VNVDPSLGARARVCTKQNIDEYAFELKQCCYCFIKRPYQMATDDCFLILESQNAGISSRPQDL